MTDLKPYISSATGFVATISGRSIDPSATKAEDIDLVDIAAGLSNLCRYAGQTVRFHSVAEHSILVSQMVEDVPGRNLPLKALLHDAPEFILNDLIRPVKRLIEGYDELEDGVMDAVAEHFGLEYSIEDWAEIRRCDDLITVVERKALQPLTATEAYSETGGKVPGLRAMVGVYSPLMAFSRFLLEFYKLTGQSLNEKQNEICDWYIKEANRYV